MDIGRSAYFVMIKRCSNACSLHFVGSDYATAVRYAQQKASQLRVATYVLTADQVGAIFDAQKDIILAWQRERKFVDDCYLELPSNFKKHLR